jgi:hypothetical protein
MTHEDAGHYGAKHPVDRKLTEKIVGAVRKKSMDGKISCAEASRIAGQLQVSMADIGVTIDLLEIHLNKCQLGLFGYSPKKMIVKPAENVTPGLEAAIRKSLVKERLPCLSVWEIAAETGMTRMAIASACEKLKIKIKPCQLGAF